MRLTKPQKELKRPSEDPPQPLTPTERVTVLANDPKYQGTAVPTAIALRDVKRPTACPPELLGQKNLFNDNELGLDIAFPANWDEEYQAHGEIPDELFAEWVVSVEQALVQGYTASSLAQIIDTPAPFLRKVEKAVREAWAVSCRPEERDRMRGAMLARSLDVERNLRRRLNHVPIDSNPKDAATLANAITSAQSRQASILGADAPKVVDSQGSAVTVNIAASQVVNPVDKVKTDLGIDLSVLDRIADQAAEDLTAIARIGMEDDDDD